MEGKKYPSRGAKRYSASNCGFIGLSEGKRNGGGSECGHEVLISCRGKVTFWET